MVHTGPVWSNVDIAPTLDRIEDGALLNTLGDGTTFRNDSGTLPSAPGLTYTEYVVPTPSAEAVANAGPQRLVVGSNGSVYYTPDHYTTFVPLGTIKSTR
jgi:filamentous hemagglutinin